MLSIKRYFSLFWFLLPGLGMLSQLSAQKAAYDNAVEQHILIQLTPEQEPDIWLKHYRQTYPANPVLIHLNKVGIGRNIHLFYTETTPTDNFLNQLRQMPGVMGLQRNGFVEFRNEPNDPLYNTQWHLDRIGLTNVWSESQGGITADGDTIVVAIMDSGFDIQHEDLRDNLWINRGEIPGDGIDNDKNGYIDDIYGWDFFSESPRIAPGRHGLGVAGIIGARGNNTLGITGVNWQVKLMYFSFNRIDKLIGAFDYVIDQRTRYNVSNGTEGSLVVATNNSFGVENIFCDPPANDSYELWSASYDAMGEVGILTAGSAANRSSNVDEFGDMPTTCSSKYLITSSNINEDDNLSGTASFGPESVDLAAPGDGSTSTAPSDGYGFFGQNSAAAPHIAGAIALLYSLPCAGIGAKARQEPAVTARAIRDAILDGTEPLLSLEGKTVTGGLLRVDNSWNLLTETICENQQNELKIEMLYPNPITAEYFTLRYLTPEIGSYQIMIYNALGQLIAQIPIDIVDNGISCTKIPVWKLSNGIYFLCFGRENEWVTRRFTVAR